MSSHSPSRVELGRAVLAIKRARPEDLDYYIDDLCNFLRAKRQKTSDVAHFHSQAPLSPPIEHALTPKEVLQDSPPHFSSNEELHPLPPTPNALTSLEEVLQVSSNQSSSTAEIHPLPTTPNAPTPPPGDVWQDSPHQFSSIAEICTFPATPNALTPVEEVLEDSPPHTSSSEEFRPLATAPNELSSYVIAKQILSLDEVIEDRLTQSPSDWIGNTRWSKDIRIIISSRGEKENGPVAGNEGCLSDRSLGIEYEIWRKAKLGKSWTPAWHKSDRTRFSSISPWLRETNTDEGDVTAKRAATRRGLILLAFDEVLGIGSQPYISEVRWKVERLSQGTLKDLHNMLRKHPDLDRARDIIQSPEAHNFVMKTQMGFHQRHDLEHLNEPWLKLLIWWNEKYSQSGNALVIERLKRDLSLAHSSDIVQLPEERTDICHDDQPQDTSHENALFGNESSEVMPPYSQLDVDPSNLQHHEYSLVLNEYDVNCFMRSAIINEYDIDEYNVYDFMLSSINEYDVYSFMRLANT